MSALSIMRANRVLMLCVAALMVASLFTPMIGVANSDISSGDTVIVSNGGNGAYLRSDTSVLDDSTIAADLPDGAILYVTDGPFFNDNGSWVWVQSDWGEGYVSTDLLVKSAASDEASTEEESSTEESSLASSTLEWLEPIDAGVVVDNNVELGENGLPVYNDASYDAGVIGYAQPGAWFDVTSERVWIGDANFVRVNFNGVGGYVDGRYIALNSEVATEEPTEEVIWEDETEVPTEEVVVTEEVVETEVPTEEVAVTEEVVETEVPTEEVVETEVPTEEVVETEVATEEATETEVVTEEVVETEIPTEEVASTPDTTEEVASTPEETEEVATEETATSDATEAATETEAPAKVETPAATEPVSIASSAANFDTSTMIGSATVTGTTSGLICRVAPDPAAAVLMTLAEGTKVMVSAEAVNGYLGIDCGGLQGFADVNYLWSGGAGDSEINASKLNVVVTGTGNGLNCRSSASMSGAIITTVADGTVLVTRGKASNGWTPVTCAGKNGYVSTTYIEVKAGSGSTSTTTSNSGTATINTGGDGLYCRSGAGTSYGVITVLSNGSTVSIRGAQQGSWLAVTCGGKNGFIFADYAKTSSSNSNSSNSGSGTSSSATGKVTIANTGGQSLNCRTGAGTSYGVITTLSLGQTVSTRSGSTNGWTAVICGGQNGFVSSDYVTGGSASSGSGNSNSGSNSGTSGTAVVDTGGDGLYCRTGAGSSYGVITTLANGTTVTTRGAASNGWTPIVCGGSNGFASSTYLKAGGSSSNGNSGSNGGTSTTGMKKNDHAKVTSAVNLRYQASTTAGVSTVVESGVVVLITGSLTNNFYPVDYDGLAGFIHKDYLTSTSAALSERGGSGSTTDPGTGSNSGTSTGNAIVNYAMRYIGYPYVWATHGPASFDCSGFTYWVIKNVLGKDIGAGTWTQVAAGTSVSKSNLQPGDLVFFQNTYTAGLSHVGIYIGNGQFIHAQNESTGVVVSDLNSSYYGPRWYGAVRIG
ncbi:MAG: C40 family peptidase [Thermomicrobiales bacterium]|nr:C40 family peptidase [Thermomicrobiales bacterium]